jgi:hypothetical protein
VVTTPQTRLEGSERPNVTDQQLPKPPRRIPISLAPSSSTPIVIGVVLCVAGFVLIGVCWSQVSLRPIVADQVPYIVSAGFTALGLIGVGATIVSIQVRRRDAEQHLSRLERLIYAAGDKEDAPPRPAQEPQSRGGVRAKVTALREPVVAALAASTVAVVAGFVLLAVAWFTTSDSSDVAAQLSYVVSGGLSGLALIAAGTIFAHVLISRGLEQRKAEVITDVVTSVRTAPGRRRRKR